jgi:hydroxypyruvate reductase
MAAAAQAGASLGYRVHEVEVPVTGEARIAGPSLLASALRAAPAGQPICVVAGGETVVRVLGHGRGGRNQELVLAMVPELARYPGVVVASVGTDGVDGPTDAAGARADSHSLARGRAAGLDPEALLADNDSYRFFDALDDLIRTGPTGSNAGDIQIVMIDSGTRVS